MKANLNGAADKLEKALGLLEGGEGQDQEQEISLEDFAASVKSATDLVKEATVNLREILVSFDEAMAQAAAKASKPLSCTVCGKPASSPVPESTVVRGFIECPECIEKQGKETLTLNRQELFDLRATYAASEQRGKDLVDKTTKEMRETTEKEREDKRIVREMYLYQQGKSAGMKEVIEEIFFNSDGFFPKS